MALILRKLWNKPRKTRQMQSSLHLSPLLGAPDLHVVSWDEHPCEPGVHRRGASQLWPAALVLLML